MMIDEIKKMDGEILTDKEVIEAIDMHEDVINFEDLGQSGLHADCNWYTVEFYDGTNIDVYIPRNFEF